MSSGPENRFIQSIHRLLGAEVYRMKNHNPYTGGVPDCWYSGNKGDLWVEYKFLELPKKPSTIVDLLRGDKPPISPLQQYWLECRHAEGRTVGVIIGTPRGGLWRPGISWREPLSSAECACALLSRADIASIITGIVHTPHYHLTANTPS